MAFARNITNIVCEIVPYDERFWCNTRHFSDDINMLTAYQC